MPRADEVCIERRMRHVAGGKWPSTNAANLRRIVIARCLSRPQSNLTNGPEQLVSYSWREKARG